MLNITNHQGNKNQTHNETSQICWTIMIKRTKTKKVTSVYEDVKKLELLYNVGGYVKWCSCYRKQFRTSPSKLIIEVPHDPETLLLDIHL